MVLTDQQRLCYTLEGKVDQSTELAKRGASVAGAEASEAQEERQECKETSHLCPPQGTTGQKTQCLYIPITKVCHPQASLAKAQEQPRG